MRRLEVSVNNRPTDLIHRNKNEVNSTNEVFDQVCIGSSDLVTENLAIDFYDLFILPEKVNVSVLELTSACRMNDKENASLIWEEFVEANTDLESVNQAEVCRDEKTMITFNGSLTYEEFDENCLNLGGRLMRSHEIVVFINDIDKIENLCTTDNSKVTWIKNISNTESDDITTQCLVMRRDGDISFQSCIRELHCGICVVPAAMQVRFYGDTNKYDRNYTLTTDEKGNPLLQGLETSRIRFDGTSWVLESDLHNEKWKLIRSSFPMGRNKWLSQYNDGVSTFTFTVCDFKSIACNNGQCVDYLNRCDGIAQCKDNSDEEHCQIIVKKPGYKKRDNPPPLNDEQTRFELDFSINLFSVADITTKEGIAHLDIMFVIDWSDPRLTIWNVYRKSKFIQCDEIWSPILNMMDGYPEAHNLKWDPPYKNRCRVNTAFRNLTSSIEDPYMG